MANPEYHEPYEVLSVEARDMHRAIMTLIEELEAVDWYNQRADVTTDDELRQVVLHHRDEEVEHAAMALEWIRRRLPVFDQELREFLYQEGPISHSHEGEENHSETQSGGDLGIGKGR